MTIYSYPYYPDDRCHICRQRFDDHCPDILCNPICNPCAYKCHHSFLPIQATTQPGFAERVEPLVRDKAGR